MTLELFTKIIERLETQSNVEQKLYSLNVVLYEFTDVYKSIIDDMIKSEYGKDGYDWWSWFLYECDYGKKEPKAWDENNNRICYDIPSLWEYMEKHKS